MRICMWSGPRNLSTAMMYSFAQRRDCDVLDEPFYAAYLAATGLDHPVRDAILANQATDPKDVHRAVTAPLKNQHQYQKHMAHHMLPGFMPEWPDDTRHVFMIRHPARVVASYAKKRESPSVDELGFVDQWRLFEQLSIDGQHPLVIDSETIRAEPRKALSALCDALDLAFDPAMLRWAAGGNPADGVWAHHWYGAVHRSTGFSEPEGELPDLPIAYKHLAEFGLAPFEKMKRLAIKI